MMPLAPGAVDDDLLTPCGRELLAEDTGEVSEVPPGENGTIMRMGRDGYTCGATRALVVAALVCADAWPLISVATNMPTAHDIRQPTTRRRAAPS